MAKPSLFVYYFYHLFRKEKSAFLNRITFTHLFGGLHNRIFNSANISLYFVSHWIVRPSIKAKCDIHAWSTRKQFIKFEIQILKIWMCFSIQLGTNLVTGFSIFQRPYIHYIIVYTYLWIYVFMLFHNDLSSHSALCRWVKIFFCTFTMIWKYFVL